MAELDKQGTGKHPHKSSEEPYPHHEASQDKEGKQGGGSGKQGGASESRSEKSSSSGDLKEREYRDEKGNVHHHTHTYEKENK